MNTPFVGKEVEKLPLGFTSSGENPNRKQRRYVAFNHMPNSTKLARGSINTNTVFRVGKYRKFTEPLYNFQKKKEVGDV